MLACARLLMILAAAGSVAAPAEDPIDEGSTHPGDAPALEPAPATPTPTAPDSAAHEAVAPPPLVPPPAGQQWLRNAVVLDVGASCLELDALLQHVVAWRESEHVDARVSIVVQGSVEDPREVAFVIRWDDEIKAKRRFPRAPAGCSDLHAVVGLALAIGLDDTLASEIGLLPTPTPAPTPIVIADADELDLPPAPARPSEPTTPRWRVTLAPFAVGSAGFAVTPGVSGGGALGLDLGLARHFDLRLAALGLFANDRPVGSGTADVTLLAGNLDACATMRPRRARGRLCAGAAAGSVASEGSDYLEGELRTVPWVGLDLGGDLRIGLGSTSGLLVGARAIVPITRLGLDVRSSSADGVVLDRVAFPPAGAIVSLGFTVDLR